MPPPTDQDNPASYHAWSNASVCGSNSTHIQPQSQPQSQRRSQSSFYIPTHHNQPPLTPQQLEAFRMKKWMKEKSERHHQEQYEKALAVLDKMGMSKGEKKL